MAQKLGELIDEISIHALREEGDATARPSYPRENHFYPRPPQGGRRIRYAPISVGKEFLSTPSARRATVDADGVVDWTDKFLSTPSARRATAGAIPEIHRRYDFYPRPPRGGRRLFKTRPLYLHQFLSTPSARRATRGPLLAREVFHISIHALREEGDSFRLRFRCTGRNFYPRPPRGGRPDAQRLSLTEARISIHALREEGDETIEADDRAFLIFLSTPSARRATA